MYQVVTYNAAGKAIEVKEGFRFGFLAERHARHRAEELRKGKGSGYDSGYLMKSQAEILPRREADGKISGFYIGKDVAECLAARPDDDFKTTMDRKVRGCRIAYTVAVEKTDAAPQPARSTGTAPARGLTGTLAPAMDQRSSL
jgi:hypothetical protein